MIESTLLIGSLFSVVDAGIYAYTGWRLSERKIKSAESSLAWRLFTVWWYGIAVTTFINGILSLLGGIAEISLPLFVSITYINILIICIALWGLLYYLIYLFTGNPRTFLPLTVFYILYYALLTYYITASGPSNVQVNRWNVALSYRSPLNGPLFVLVLLLLILPQMIGSLAYFTLYFRVKEATQRYRILLVSLSIFVWFGSALAASATGFSQQDDWQIVSRVIGLAAALTALLAYMPPKWLRQRYGITAIHEEPDGR